MFATHFVGECEFSTECSLPCSQPTSSRRGIFIVPMSTNFPEMVLCVSTVSIAIRNILHIQNWLFLLMERAQ